MAYQYPYDNEEKEYKQPKLKTNRNMWKFLILNILTLGIYGIIFFILFSYDLDKAAPKSDRTKTMNFLIAFIISFFTFSIVLVVWHYQIAGRVEETLRERDIPYEFGTSTFWCWYFFGAFILVGSFVYIHKLCKAMNLLCEHYNENTVTK